MGATLRPVPDSLATPATSSSDSEFKMFCLSSSWPRRAALGPLSPLPCPLLRAAPILAWWGQQRWPPDLSLCFQNLPKPPAQQPDPAHPGGPEPQKTGEVDGPQGAVETPTEPPFSPALHPAALGSEQVPGRCSSAPRDEVAYVAKESRSPSPPLPPRTKWHCQMTLDVVLPGVALSTCPIAGQEVYLFGLCLRPPPPPPQQTAGLCPRSSFSDFPDGTEAASC